MNYLLNLRSRILATILVGVGILAGVLVGGFVYQQYFAQRTAASARRLLVQAREALRTQKFKLAEELVGKVDGQDPLFAECQLVAGEAATRDGRLEDAVRHYQSIPRDDSSQSAIAIFAQAEVCRDLGWLSEAEQNYVTYLKLQPDDASAHERLTFLYGATGKRWESLPHFMFLLRQGTWTLESLVLMGDMERPIDQHEFISRCERAVPNDVLVIMARGAEAVAQGRAAAARKHLSQVVKSDPSLLAAQAMLGELLVDSDSTSFARWHAGLPSNADSHPDIWFVRGLRARRLGDLRVAARCFWESVRQAPTHRRGSYQLGQVLVALGESSGQEFSRRSSQLFDLTQALDNVQRSKGQSEDLFIQVTRLLEETGRLWEARAWAQTATETFSDATWANETVKRLTRAIQPTTPETLDSANLALQFNLSSFPYHKQIFDSSAGATVQSGTAANQLGVRFATEPESTGITFHYFNGSDPLREEVTEQVASAGGEQLDARIRIRIKNRTRIFEQNGGGVAVLDFDGDRWPDLGFTQGSVWKHGSLTPSPTATMNDRLYRNSQGQSFRDVTADARLADQGYGQGCAVGDFDNDGFPDLYVANIGRNRLHHNNGDGTFTDVTDEAGLHGNDWTASCVVVDLNADGFPDLFDVTYVTGPNVYEAVCNGHACSPKIFEGIPDRLWISRGDGTFELMADATPTAGSKGLGVIAVDLFQNGRPCLFVANDQVPDHFLRNLGADNTPHLKLVDEGFQSGLAFNEDGLALASMGIAADDANGDGRIDFFVTNFKDESDVLYIQDSPGLFVDTTNAAGLKANSLPYVGWGTQFLDADRDGEPDLVVTNGHVDDYRGEGGDYHMRPQFYLNLGQGRFRELPATEAGAYFDRKYLGRGLARLDWNADGHMDFVVNNIGDAATLVTNKSGDQGHYLNVRLHSTTTARDAIGTQVEVTAGTRHWTKQLLAGDGYMASNERVLQFGLGTATRVKEIRVRWPSGAHSVLRDVPADVTIELIEGLPHANQWQGMDARFVPVKHSLPDIKAVVEPTP